MRTVLATVASEPQLTVPDIAHRLQLDRQPVQRNVNELLELKYVRKKENPEHKRSPFIVATPAGKRMLLKVQKEEDALLGALADNTNRRDLKPCYRMLEALTARCKASGWWK